MTKIRQELHFRLIFSCIVSSAISTFSLFFFSCLLNSYFSCPWQWIIDALLGAFSPKQFVGYSFNILCTCLVTLLYYSKISVSDRIVVRYLDVFVELIWTNIHTILLSTVIAGFHTLFVLGIVAPGKYSSIFSDSQFLTLNQRTHCLVSYGCFIGLVFSITLLVFNRLTLLYSQPATGVLGIIKEHISTRALTTIGRIFYFIPLYALCPKPFCWIRQTQLSFWRIIFDVRLLFLLFVVGFHVQFSWGCAVSILKWQLSKPIITPLSSLVDPVDSTQSAFSKSTNLLEQHLALERLADLVAIDSDARASIFSLSTLGGRPLFWRQISTWCTTVLEQFASRIQMANSSMLQNSVKSAFFRQESENKNNVLASLRYQIRSRSLTTAACSPAAATECAPPVTPESWADLFLQGDVAAMMKMALAQISIFATRFTILRPLGSDLSYSTTAQLFNGPAPTGSAYGSGQSVISAIEILACLTLASYTEDTYGSVQRSLGRILVLFADALDAVERHLKLAGLLTKELSAPSLNVDGADAMQNLSTSIMNLPLTPVPTWSNVPWKADVCSSAYYKLASDPTLPWRIHATLTWAITNGLRQFGDHLESIQLSQRARERLRSLRSKYVIDDETDGSLQP